MLKRLCGIVVIDIHDQVAHITLGHHRLRQDIDACICKRCVNLRQDAGDIFVDMQQSVRAVCKWDLDIGEVHTARGVALV